MTHRTILTQFNRLIILVGAVFSLSDLVWSFTIILSVRIFFLIFECANLQKFYIFGWPFFFKEPY